MTTSLIACADETTETETQMPVPTNENTAGSEMTFNRGIENNSNADEAMNNDVDEMTVSTSNESENTDALFFLY